MRHHLPPKKIRQQLYRYLVTFFRNENPDGYTLFLKEICRYYKLRRPKTVWADGPSLGRDYAGRTYDNGEIHLIRPEEWVAMPEKYDRSIKEWLRVVYHEFFHYKNWVDEEKKADDFAYQMLAGLEGLPR